MYRLIFQGNRPAFLGREVVTSIGRDANCSLQLTEAGIADRHAIIERRADGLYIHDLGSTGGVRVNGQPVVDQRLTTRDEIELGAVKAVFEIAFDPVSKHRATDFWQTLAIGVVALIVAGQVTLFAWILSQEHPRHGRTDMTRAAKQTTDTLVPDILPTTALTPLPATGTSQVPVSEVLNRTIRIVRVDATDGGLRIQIKAQVAERKLDPSAIAISVQCANGPVWIRVPADWANFSSKTLTAPCTGTIVRTYYRQKLQDEWKSR